MGKPGVFAENLGTAASTPSVAVGGVCPACSSAEASLLFSATDRLYATTDKVFQIIECRQCRLIRLHPQPKPGELRDYYPPEFWFVPGTTVADRLEQW